MKALLALPLTIAALALAPTAAADPMTDADKTDIAFVSVIGQHTSIPQPSAAKIIGLGKAVCEDLREGTSEYNEAAEIMVGFSKIGIDVSGADAGYFVGASEAAYCPEQHH